MFTQAGHATRYYACNAPGCTRDFLIQPGDTYVRRVYPSGIVTYRHTDVCGADPRLVVAAASVDAETRNHWATRCRPLAEEAMRHYREPFAHGQAVPDGYGGWIITGELDDENERSQPTDEDMRDADRFAAIHPDEAVHPDNVFWLDNLEGTDHANVEH